MHYRIFRVEFCGAKHTLGERVAARPRQDFDTSQYGQASQVGQRRVAQKEEEG